MLAASRFPNFQTVHSLSFVKSAFVSALSSFEELVLIMHFSDLAYLLFLITDRLWHWTLKLYTRISKDNLCVWFMHNNCEGGYVAFFLAADD